MVTLILLYVNFTLITIVKIYMSVKETFIIIIIINCELLPDTRPPRSLEILENLKNETKFRKIFENHDFSDFFSNLVIFPSIF